MQGMQNLVQAKWSIKFWANSCRIKLFDKFENFIQRLFGLLGKNKQLKKNQCFPSFLTTISDDCKF